MTLEDRKMYEKGYRYRCDPVNNLESPYLGLYAKTLAMVALIHRDYPKQRFTVVKLECWLDAAVGQA